MCKECITNYKDSSSSSSSEGHPTSASRDSALLFSHSHQSHDPSSPSNISLSSLYSLPSTRVSLVQVMQPLFLFLILTTMARCSLPIQTQAHWTILPPSPTRKVILIHLHPLIRMETFSSKPPPPPPPPPISF